MQASTLAHEFGHTAERRHGGEAFEPNCNPGYLSVMNYLYQLRGLLDDDGSPALDFSEGTPFVDVDEAAVQEGVLSTSRFRLSWYAPIDFSYLKDRRAPVKSRCDGSALGPERAHGAHRRAHVGGADRLERQRRHRDRAVRAGRQLQRHDERHRHRRGQRSAQGLLRRLVQPQARIRWDRDATSAVSTGWPTARWPSVRCRSISARST